MSEPRIGTTPLFESELPLPLLHRGKVRDMYEAGPEHLLMVATDRVSAFDIVLPRPVPRKGEVLTLLTAWWLERLGDRTAHHLVAARPDEILERVPDLRETEASRWARRALLVRRTRPLPVECVARGYLAGSAWREYRASGTLAGERLPPGLREAERLEPPIFSPATKAVEGHDENILFSGVVERVGAARAERLRELTLELYTGGRETAGRRGLILADTKFEFGEGPGGELLLIDEVLTPDSSRYWPAEAWRPGETPASLDKQPVRDWLDALPGWDRQSAPEEVQPGVIEATTERYVEIFRRLTGTDLDRYDPPSFPAPG